ncbi:hypothetical protein Nepgr_010971 [Nepenthes gracilis]|uniref:Gamma-glutamylcyclotransferase family protein n=1 Tax=Nepenthes gracilis TaxID=150966 RepID=A0AAD3SE86_NEPGR|nr:hypothetical protein Nepgr_010971 [Nepenthes gracilis]
MGLVKEGEKKSIFTYGTLKRGFPNHPLMQDLMASGDADYLGRYRTVEKFPLVCGPFRVPFLLNLPGLGDRVWGELYAVSNQGLARMDELEGTSLGHYERLPIKVSVVGEEADECAEAEAYFGHRSYTEEMWRRNGEKGYASYSETEARGYVRRGDRPRNLTFLDQIRIFVSSPPPDSSDSFLIGV